MDELTIHPLDESVKETRKDHMQLILLAIRSGTKFENFRKLLARLLRIHLDSENFIVNDLNMDLWAINREIHFLPRRVRIRIDKTYIVETVEYLEVNKYLRVVRIVG